MNTEEDTIEVQCSLFTLLRKQPLSKGQMVLTCKFYCWTWEAVYVVCSFLTEMIQSSVESPIPYRYEEGESGTEPSAALRLVPKGGSVKGRKSHQFQSGPLNYMHMDLHSFLNCEVRTEWILFRSLLGMMLPF